MARLTRVQQLIFAASAANNGVFGSAQANAGPGTISNDLATIMGLAAWSQGWLDAILGSSKFPTVEEMQGIQYVMTSQLAYLFQQGIPEYDGNTTYYIKSMCIEPGTYKIYGSLTNANQGNALSDVVNWQLLQDLSAPAQNVYTGGTTTGSANVQAVTPVTPAATSFANGQTVICTAGFTNSGSMTFSAGGETALTVKKDSGSGLVVLTGGEVVAGNTVGFTKNIAGNAWVLQSGLPLGALAYLNLGYGIENDLAGSAQVKASLLPVKSSFKNLNIFYSSITQAVIVADEAILENSTGQTYKATAVNLPVNTGTSGAGGLDTGSLAASTWYFLYLIYNGTTVNTLMSASATAPTLPGGYTFITGPIGTFRLDGSVHIIGFQQYNRSWQYRVGQNLSQLPSLASGSSGSPSTPTFTSTAWATIAPSIITKMNLQVYSLGASQVVIAPNNSYGAINTSSQPPGVNIAAVQTLVSLIPESANVFYASNGTGGVNVLGFELNT